MTINLSGKTAVVTGATSGIGFQAAFDLAKAGANIIGVGRNPQRCAAAKQKIIAAGKNVKVEFLIADLSEQKQIQELAKDINTLLDEWKCKGLDVLVNNAGVYMIDKVFTPDGVETTFAVNHVAAFLLTHLLLPRLIFSGDGRVITVSSDTHYSVFIHPEKTKNPPVYFGLWAYGASKLANVLFSREFNRLYENQGVRAFAVDPGLVNTDIGLKGTKGLVKSVWEKRQKRGVSAEVPSKTIVHLAGESSVLNSSEVYWYLCQPRRPSRAALNDNLARRLWVESCKICCLPIPAQTEVKDG